MKILLICDEYPPGKNGGIGTMVQVMARALVAEGHQVWVAGLYTYAYGSADEENDQGVQVYRKRYGFRWSERSLLRRVYHKMPGAIKQLLPIDKDYAQYISFVKDLVKQQGIDIIEVADWSTPAFETGRGLQWPHFACPLVVKMHGSYTYFQDELGKVVDRRLRDIDESLLQRADALCAVSAYTAGRTKEIFGLTKDIGVLHNAIDVPTMPKQSVKRKNQVVFSGSLVEKKGIFQLMKAWNLVVENCPDAQLTVFGKGDASVLRALLTAQAKKQVNFEGHVTRERLLQQLETSVLAVFPSYSETFGLMCIEAMSRACAVIYTKRSCGPEIITQGYDGVLVDPDDVLDLANQIVKLIKDENLSWVYGTKAYDSVKLRFSIEHSVDVHLNYYQSTIANFKQKQKNM